jgi:hypothetical protein
MTMKSIVLWVAMLCSLVEVLRHFRRMLVDFLPDYTLLHSRITGFLDFFPSSGVLETRKHDVLETGSVFVLRCGGKALSD